MEKDTKDMQKAGNFTKNAIESFEENIVSKTNFLESVNNNIKSKNNNSNIKER